MKRSPDDEYGALDSPEDQIMPAKKPRDVTRALTINYQLADVISDLDVYVEDENPRSRRACVRRADKLLTRQAKILTAIDARESRLDPSLRGKRGKGAT